MYFTVFFFFCMIIFFDVVVDYHRIESFFLFFFSFEVLLRIVKKVFCWFFLSIINKKCIKKSPFCFIIFSYFVKLFSRYAKK